PSLYVPALKKIMNVGFGATSALLARHIGRLRHCQLRRTGGLVSAMSAAGAMIGTGLDSGGRGQAVDRDQADLRITYFDVVVSDPAEGSNPRAHHCYGNPHTWTV